MRDRHGLLDPGFLAQLERLTLRARRRFNTIQQGEKRSRRPGSGLEFAGHRGYVPGDDLRHLDWTLLGRLDRPFMKIFEQESALTVHLLVDASRSMAYGEPGKFLAASRLAAALAYIALGSLDRVSVTVFDGRGMKVQGPGRGRGSLFRLLEFLAAQTPDGPGGVEEALRRHAAAAAAGLTFVFSDFLDPDLPRAVLPHRFRRHSLALVQILAPEELDPTLDGDLKLIDAESGEELEVSVGPRERTAYRARIDAHREELRRFAARYGADWVSIASDCPLEDALWDHLLRGSFVARG